jgi:hypothetical protein
MSKIDTQGMSISAHDADGDSSYSYSVSLPDSSPFPSFTRNVFTDLERSELKSIIIECLQEFFNEQES